NKGDICGSPRRRWTNRHVHRFVLESGARVDAAPGTSMSRAPCAPWLTGVIPSYCGELWIDIALQSLACEAADGIEVLVIDGSPTSATCDIARTYLDRLRLRVFERRDLLTWQAKTNFGVQMAESSHVCWLGVD